MPRHEPPISIKFHDSRGLRVKQGNLRFEQHEIRVDFGGNGDAAPDECCCAEDPDDHLTNAADDLESFFDKWYGSASKSIVSGFYEWSGGACGNAGIRVPTADTLADVSTAANLCLDPPPKHRLAAA